MNNKESINKIILYEESLIHEFIQLTKHDLNNEGFVGNDLVRYNLIRRDCYNVTVLAHQFVIQKLLDFACEKLLKLKNPFLVYEHDFILDQDFNLDFLEDKSELDIFEILEIFHIYFLNSNFSYQNNNIERIKSKINSKDTGSVYTQNEIARTIVLQTIKNRVSQGDNPKLLKILDFGCGTGRFYFSVLQVLDEIYGIPKIEAIKNIYAIDIDKVALSILKLKILFETDIKSLEIINQNIINKNMLIVSNRLIFEESNFKIILDKGGFDVIISNPPYFLLKINKSNLKDKVMEKYYQTLTEKIKSEINYFRNSGFYSHSIEGMLNYYKISIEMILKLSNQNTEIGIICPSTLFGDLSSTKIRKFILNQNKLRKVEFFPENTKLFENVSQATSIFYISKQQKTNEIQIKIKENIFNISYKLIKNNFPDNFEVPQMNEIDWNILKKLNKFKKLKEFNSLRNRRGELDLMNFKELITTRETDFRLIRGNMINNIQIDYSKGNEFVKIDEFIKAKSQDFITNDFQTVRLVCQQISNIDTYKRLKFVFCSKNDILSNSCNYISLNEQTSIKNLQVLLNSYLLNWRFKITSTNNHINNYELDELPLIDFTNFNNCINGNELKNNIEIAKMYGLNSNEIKYLLADHFEIEEMNKYL